MAKLRGLDGKIDIGKKDPNAIKSAKAGRDVLKKVEVNRKDLLEKKNVVNKTEKKSTETDDNKKLGKGMV